MLGGLDRAFSSIEINITDIIFPAPRCARKVSLSANRHQHLEV